MSKVPYTININRYICSELEIIRKMIETHDFSSLPAVVERIQFHATSMEDALYRYDNLKYHISKASKAKEVTDKQFRKNIKDVIKKLKK